jgi:hypothetical protein
MTVSPKTGIVRETATYLWQRLPAYRGESRGRFRPFGPDDYPQVMI